MIVRTMPLAIVLLASLVSSPSGGVDVPKPENAVYMKRTPSRTPERPPAACDGLNTLTVFMPGLDIMSQRPMKITTAISMLAITEAYLNEPLTPSTETM